MKKQVVYASNLIVTDSHAYEVWNGFEWHPVSIEKSLKVEVDDKGQFWVSLPKSGAKLLCRFVQWPLPPVPKEIVLV